MQTERGFKPITDEDAAKMTRTPRTVSAAELATEYRVSDTTIRVNWFNWLVQVAPEEKLRNSDGYTALAQTMFKAIAPMTAVQRRKWVESSKPQYEYLWANTPNSSPEQLPEQAEIKGGAIAARTEIVDVTPFDLGDPIVTTRLNTSAINQQTEQIWGVASGQEEQILSLFVGRFEALGDRIVAEGKNRVARKVAQGFRDLVQ